MTIPGIVWVILGSYLAIVQLVVAARQSEIRLLWHQPSWSRQWPTVPWGWWLRQAVRFGLFAGLGIWYVGWAASTAVHNARYGWPSGLLGNPEFLACVVVIGGILIATAWAGLVTEPTHRD